MPLPAALLARLQKRGIITRKPDKDEEIEEVFAEDYDDPSKEAPPEALEAPPIEEPPSPEPDDEDEPEAEENKPLVHEVLACPNRANRFHECSDYCRERWGLKSFEADSNMIKRRDRMLKNYPLPEGWEEVADPGTARYYYWHVQTDQVSWLSPAHPRSEITVPAEKSEDSLTGLSPLHTSFSKSFVFSLNQSSLSSDSESEEEPLENRKRPLDDDRPVGDKERGGKRGRGRGRGRSRGVEELDPMDPASYSEVPRGTWSTGLETRGEAKTGVDITASGPLFQQRPYPSPGDVLRANRAMTDQKK
ncbi:hypothetical protein ScPMuIL_008924 [Solemya velum]